MTWYEEDRKKVEEAVLEACENTKYANGIDELFDGETWVVDFYEIATQICDELETKTNKVTDEEFEDFIRDQIKGDIEWFTENVIELCKFRLDDAYEVELVE